MRKARSLYRQRSGWVGRLLAAAGVQVEVHANPGRFVPGRGLIMEMPIGSPYLSRTLGVDKAQVVRSHLDAGRMVGFAGDGFPDAEAARLVAGDLRFARGDLAEALQREGLPYRSFATWSDIARALLQVAPEVRSSLKSAGYLTRDSRAVERKKYGRAGARRRFQFSKR